MKIRAILYAEAGQDVGTGHIYRLWPIFCALRKRGVEARMYVPLSDAKLKTYHLEGMTGESGPDKVLSAVESLRPHILILDTYIHMRRLVKSKLNSKNRLTAIFDDHYKVDFNVDVIINTSPSVRMKYYSPNAASHYLLGTDFSPISESFIKAKQRFSVRQSAEKILLALGGNDVQRNLDVLINSVVTGIGDKKEVSILGDNLPGIVGRKVRPLGWLRHDHLADVVCKHDIAVIAGGSMIHQFACVGLPTISWPQTENQNIHAKAWHQKGAIIMVDGFDHISKALTRLDGYEQRMLLSESAKKVVDGKGVGRILDTLIGKLKESDNKTN